MSHPISNEILIEAASLTQEETGKGVDSWGELEACICRNHCGEEFAHVETDWVRNRSQCLRKRGLLRKIAPNQVRNGQVKPKGYDEFMQSPEWEALKKRAEKWWVAVFGKLVCVMCARTTDIQWHHRHYNKPWGNEHETDIVPTCKYCHARHHGKD